jgi:hypothetical protein
VSGRQALTVTAGAGNVAFNGVLGTAVDSASSLASLAVSGSVVDLDDVFADGAVSVAGTTRIDLNGGTYDSTTAGFVFTGPVQLTADTTITTGEGAVTT